MIPTIHPFPARMAPELALNMLNDLPTSSVVLDPMSGSGTVLRQAAEIGHRAFGFDLDPLAVLMSRAWNTPVADDIVEQVTTELLEEARGLDGRTIILPWIDADIETAAFVKFWFGPKQRADLRRLAFVLDAFEKRRFGPVKQAAADVLRIALSRIIVTKERGASLARDTSHSRPHKVVEKSDYEVFRGLARSLKQVRQKLGEHPPWGGVQVALGDARRLKAIRKGSVDAVLTSPPYLNAIDYLRGHRLSLVWLGHTLSSLRTVRATSIGAERAPESDFPVELCERIQSAMFDGDVSARHLAMIKRYCHDLILMMSEITRVTRVGGLVTLVVGNSCLKGHFIRNSGGVCAAAAMAGMKLLKMEQRDLPVRSRYLPMPGSGALSTRMRTETVISFGRV
jgi:hypothetical protein